MRVAGRLAPGMSLDAARVQLEAVWPSIKADIIPPTHAGAQRDKAPPDLEDEVDRREKANDNYFSRSPLRLALPGRTVVGYRLLAG